jgi:MFS family permease
LVFFGGIIGDKIGLRMAGLIFSGLVVIGAILVPLGASLAGWAISPFYGYIIMLIGRFIFGAGAESLNVIQTSMTTKWFRSGKRLAFAMGIVLSMSRLGDFLALAITVELVKAVGDFRETLWIGTILCAFSFFCVMLYGIFDKKAEKYVPTIIDPTENELNFKAIFHFDVRFWIISCLCMCYYSGIFPFVTVCSDFLQNKYNYSENVAGWLASIITLSSMCLSPILGKFLDVVGRRPFFIILGSLAILPCHLILAWTKLNPIPFIIIIGLSFSLVPSALWPSVPLLVAPHETATAFGLMTSIQNAGLAGTNQAGGALANINYEYAMLFFAGMDLIGLILGILLAVIDKIKGNTLSKVSKKKDINGYY